MQVTTQFDFEDKTEYQNELSKFDWKLVSNLHKFIIVGPPESQKCTFLNILHKKMCSKLDEILYFEEFTMPFNEKAIQNVLEKTKLHSKKFGLFLDSCEPWLQSSPSVRNILTQRQDSFFAVTTLCNFSKYYFWGLSFHFLVLFRGLSNLQLKALWNQYLAWIPTLEQFFYIYQVHTTEFQSCLIIDIHGLNQSDLSKEAGPKEIYKYFYKYNFSKNVFM